MQIKLESQHIYRVVFNASRAWLLNKHKTHMYPFKKFEWARNQEISYSQINSIPNLHLIYFSNYQLIYIYSLKSIPYKKTPILLSSIDDCIYRVLNPQKDVSVHVIINYANYFQKRGHVNKAVFPLFWKVHQALTVSRIFLCNT